MKRIFFLALIIFPLLCSCSKEKVIPKDTLSLIYYDMYLADNYLSQNSRINSKSDSLLIYEAVFNKYGYTTADYNRTIDQYLLKPKKFSKVFIKTQDMLKKRRDNLNYLIQREEGKVREWDLLNTIKVISSAKVGGNAYYRAINIIFFTPDSVTISSPVIDSTVYEIKHTPYLLYESIPTIKEGFVPIIKIFRDTSVVSASKEIVTSPEKSTTPTVNILPIPKKSERSENRRNPLSEELKIDKMTKEQ